MERRVRVLRTAESLIREEEEEEEAGGRFEAEMAKMAEEMARFRSHLMLGESRRTCRSSHSSTSYSASTRTTRTSSKAGALADEEEAAEESAKEPEQGPEVGKQVREERGGPLDGFSSPLIREPEGGGERLLSIRFDVRPYAPDQIVVKTVDNLLTVHAKLEQLGAESSLRREYNREFLLPPGTQLEHIRSSLSADGVLTVEAPLGG